MARRHTPWNLPPWLLVAAGLLMVPIAVPWAVVAHHIDRWRLRAVAARTACPVCNELLDLAALAAAERHRQEAIAALRRAFPTERIQVGEFPAAICGHCGAHLRFGKVLRTFEAVAVSGPALALRGSRPA